MPDLFKSFIDFFKSKDADHANQLLREKYFETLQSFEGGANKLITWSLSIMGGSLLAIISDSYLHPESRILKMGYLIFLFGWIFLGKVIYHGNKIARTNILVPLNKDNLSRLQEVFKICNSNYSLQLKYFNLALLVFGIWLVAYLIWWIFFKIPINTKPEIHNYYGLYE